ncbi:MAG: hypothetical protein GKR94_33165 [Gammaproteobacteria bacterium]|nr:hypothetical protein [Gammaproteobacteria bacterium]
MRLNVLLAHRHEYRILGLMLFVLHGTLWLDFGSAASRSLWLAHFGLFLIWQPIWRREKQLAMAAAGISILCIVAAVAWMDWGLITVWLVLLIGLVGGRMTEGRRARTAYMITMIFLVIELLIGAVPPMFGIHISGLVRSIAQYGLLAVPCVLLLVPAHQTAPRATHAVDFLCGLTVSLLVSVLAMGALLRWFDAGVGYPVALFQTTASIGVFLLAISWLWAPFAGFSGLGQLWTRYLMNIGTPFEVWLHRIATLARRLRKPDDFLAAAMRELLALPWVLGVTWRARPAAAPTHLGDTSQNAFTIHDEGIRVTVYLHDRIGTALSLHGKLLIRLLAHFHRAKAHETELTHRAHMEAVYETGARITHDIKNLLQSLYGLTAAIEGTPPAKRDELLHLLERQLPALSSRLRLALDKLQTPQVIAHRKISIADWWTAFCQRHERSDVELHADIETPYDIPEELFDSVGENLLENARYKQQQDASVKIGVELEATSQKLRLAVRDTGHALAPELLDDLLKAPVASESGLGIGLFQAAKHAEQHGFRLYAKHLESGNVTFELTYSESRPSREHSPQWPPNPKSHVLRQKL